MFEKVHSDPLLAPFYESKEIKKEILPKKYAFYISLQIGG
jgi:hypothetical protein